MNNISVDSTLFFLLAMLFWIFFISFVVVLRFKFLRPLIIIPYQCYKVGKTAFLSNSTANEQENHTAIIVVDSQSWNLCSRYRKNYFIYRSGVELLISGLNDLPESYKIHHPSTRNQFKEIIKTKTAKRIWIFAHGSKEGIKVGKEILHFKDFKGLNKVFNKEYIMQLQCWGSKELIEYLCDNPSKSCYKYRVIDFDENRKFIIKTLEKMKKGEF